MERRRVEENEAELEWLREGSPSSYSALQSVPCDAAETVSEPALNFSNNLL